MLSPFMCVESITVFDMPQGVSGAASAKLLESKYGGRINIARSLDEALELAKQNVVRGRVFVTGSLYFMSDALKLLDFATNGIY